MLNERLLLTITLKIKHFNLVTLPMILPVVHRLYVLNRQRGHRFSESHRMTILNKAVRPGLIQ